MTAYTPELDSKIRHLGLALKAQLDFAAAADMTKPDDAMAFAQRNSTSALMMIEVMQALGVPLQNDADALEQIAAAAKANNSDAGDLLLTLAPKVRAINAETAEAVAQSAREGKTFTAADLNKILRKNLTP